MDYSVFDTIPVGLCVVRRDSDDLICLYANRVMTNMLGSNPTGKNLDNACKGTEQLAAELKKTTPAEEIVLPYTKNGQASWALITIAPERFQGQDCYAIWAVDISASKKAEQQADAASEQKSNFLATISHEIRTPMQSVYGLLEMIELDKPSPNILAMAQTARASASGLLEILDDVLDFAKMDADQMELDLFEVPVRTLVRGILEALSVKVQGKNIDLLDDIDADVPAVISGDPKRLRQIIVNLMGNAMKFTQTGSITIRVTKKPAGSHVILRFEIIDTGIGMSEDVAARLFRPFSQADNSTSRKYGGTGLGLSICKKLVEMMNGAIGVSSIPGKGSTFWFEIPTTEVAVDSNLLSLPKLDGISVLSVEDHPMGAKEIAKSLKSMGATVESCGTVAEALALIKRRPFDVGVIDQGLPDGLGLDLIRDIMEARPFMGLVMYTVRDDAGLQHSLQSLGVSYLTKPASRIGLGEAVQDAATKIKNNIIEGPRKLVIAEDTGTVRDVLQRQLDMLGVEATFVENGREAIKAVRSGEYGILITDLHMPEVDGYGVVKAVRGDDEMLDRHFPVVVLTADVQMSQRQVYMGHGFDECLLKPVSLGQFRRLLIRWGLLSDQDTLSPPPALPAEKQSSSVIDKNAIIEQMGAFDDGAIEMLKLFPSMMAPLLSDIHAALAAKDFHTLHEAGHSIKGAARFAGLNILGDIAALLQDEAQKKNSCDSIVTELQAAFDAACLEIERL